MTENDGEFKQGNRLEHGLRSVFARGYGTDETSLTELQRGRLAELRAELATTEGVIDAMRERAARMVLICEWAESWLQREAETKGGIEAFEAKVMQRFFTAQAEARRSLEALIKAQGKGDGGLSAGDVLESLRHGKDK